MVQIWSWNRNRNRNRNFSKVGTGTGTLTFSKVGTGTGTLTLKKIGTRTGTVKNSYGSTTLGSGSGSSDPCFWLMDPDSDPESGSCCFLHWPSRCQQKTIFNKKFSAYYFLKVHLHHFSKIKSQKESQNRRNQGFSYYICMMIEGSGSIPLTSGSGSGRPKNMWIPWIRIRLRNTGRNICTRLCNQSLPRRETQPGSVSVIDGGLKKAKQFAIPPTRV